MNGGGSSAEVASRTMHAATVLFLLSAAFVTLRTGRDALFLDHDGLFALPRAYIAQAVLGVPQAMAVLWLMRRVGVRSTRVLTIASAAAVGLVYALFGRPGGSWPMVVLFFLVPLVFSVAFSFTWLLGSELFVPFDRQASSRAFGRLGAASIVGGLAGGVVSRASGPVLGARALLSIGALLAAAALVGAVRAHRAHPMRPLAASPATPEPESPSLLSVLHARSVAPLLGVAGAIAATGILVDFQFYIGAASGAGDARIGYIANAYLCLSAGALGLQLLVAPWLARRVGQRGALLMLPVTLAVGGSVAFSSLSGLVRAGLRVVEGSVKQGVHRASWEQAFVGLPDAVRSKVKVLVDGVATRVAEGVAAAMVLGWMSFASQGDATNLRLAWVAEVGAASLNAVLVVVALAAIALTLLLARRMPVGAGRGPADASAVPIECCAVTAAEGERLLLLGRTLGPEAPKGG